MHSEAEEYFQPVNGSNGNGNGNSNGRPEHRKVFDLVPAKDETTEKILGARMRVLLKHYLSEGSRLLFVLLLDLAVRSSSNIRFGCVKISRGRLAELVNVCERTIDYWKGELLAEKLVWVEKKKTSNAWPAIIWHISELDPINPYFAKNAEDGFQLNARLREAPNHGIGARKPGQKSLPLATCNGLQVAPRQRKTAKTPDFAGESRSQLQVPAATGCGSEPQNIAGESRNTVRVGAATGCGSEPQYGSGQTRKSLRLAPAKDCSFKKTKGTVKESSELGGAPPSSEEWRKKLGKLFPDELKALKTDLVSQQKRLAPDDPQFLDIICRIEAIDVALYGAKVPARPTPAKRPESKSVPKSLTEAELLESAKHCLDNGWSLTQGQKAAAAKAGLLK